MAMPAEYVVVGHVNPMDAYPAYVVPVVSAESGPSAVFLNHDHAFEFERVDEFSRTSPRTLHEGPAKIGRSSHSRLFAFDVEKTFLYEAFEATDFWYYAVNEERILALNPFSALDIAIDTEDRAAMITALTACIAVLKEHDISNVGLVENWYRSQLREFQRELSFDLSLPDEWHDLATEALLLPEAALPLLDFRTRSPEQALSRPGVDVRVHDLQPRRGRTLIEGLFDQAAELCAQREQVLEWRALFDFYALGIEPSTIAHRLKLEGTSEVATYVARAMAALQETCDEARRQNPALQGLTTDLVVTALKSPRTFVRQQGIDVVFCIDTTASMKPFIETARRIVSGFHERLLGRLSARGIVGGQVNARILAFRDFLSDDEPIRETSFMRLPLEEWAFRSIVNDLEAEGGGDEPESSLEAFAIALRSSWASRGSDSASVIMLLTDAPAHSFEEMRERTPLGYPSGMPYSLFELQQRWETFCSESATAVQRFVLFAPDVPPWSEIARKWRNTIHIVSMAGAGLEKIPDNLIIDSIVDGLV